MLASCKKIYDQVYLLVSSKEIGGLLRQVSFHQDCFQDDEGCYRLWAHLQAIRMYRRYPVIISNIMDFSAAVDLHHQDCRPLRNLVNNSKSMHCRRMNGTRTCMNIVSGSSPEVSNLLGLQVTTLERWADQRRSWKL